LVQFIDG